MFNQFEKTWFCSDDGLYNPFENQTQSIIGGVLFLLLLPCTIHFFCQVGVCRCCNYCDCCNCEKHLLSWIKSIHTHLCDIAVSIKESLFANRNFNPNLNTSEITRTRMESQLEQIASDSTTYTHNGKHTTAMKNTPISQMKFATPQENEICVLNIETGNTENQANRMNIGEESQRNGKTTRTTTTTAHFPSSSGVAGIEEESTHSQILSVKDNSVTGVEEPIKIVGLCGTSTDLDLKNGISNVCVDVDHDYDGGSVGDDDNDGNKSDCNSVELELESETLPPIAVDTRRLQDNDKYLASRSMATGEEAIGDIGAPTQTEACLITILMAYDIQKKHTANTLGTITGVTDSGGEVDSESGDQNEHKEKTITIISPNCNNLTGCGNDSVNVIYRSDSDKNSDVNVSTSQCTETTTDPDMNDEISKLPTPPISTNREHGVYVGESRASSCVTRTNPKIPISRSLRCKNTKNRKKQWQAQQQMPLKVAIVYSLLVCVNLLLIFVTAIGKYFCVLEMYGITWFISLFGHILLYGVVGLSINIAFTLRLKQSFEASVFEFNPRTIVFIMICALISPILLIIGIGWYIIFDVANVLYWFGATADICYALLFFCLVCMFILRLKMVCQIVLLACMHYQMFRLNLLKKKI